MSGYHSPITAIQDSIDRRFEIARVREQNRKVKDVELAHFKNVVISRLGTDPDVARVISTWKSGKDPVNCKMQILCSKDWSVQQRTDIEEMFISFKHLNDDIWNAERKYGSNPRVRALIDNVRKSDDIRVIPFERSLEKIIKEEF